MFRLTLIALALALAVACAPAKQDKQTTAANAGPNALPERLIAVEPRFLPLNDISMIGGAFTSRDAQVTSAAWSRSFDRAPDDPTIAQGALRVTAGGQLYKSVADAVDDFQKSAEGPAGREFVAKALRSRGLEDGNMSIEPMQLGAFGVNQEQVWRATTFQSANPRERYDEYWIFLRLGNTRALLTVFAPRPNPGTEAPRLREDAIAVAQAQAAQLKALPSQPPK